MSGPRLPYLERRQGMWNLRVRVPDGVKLRVGLSEVRRSLRTYSVERARLLAVQLVARLQEIFHMAETTPISKNDVRRLVDRCFQALSAETESTAPCFDDVARETHEQRRMIDERGLELRAQIRSGRFAADIERMAAEVLREQGSRIVVCVDMLGEGFDLPYLKIAALHDNHKSLAITLQFIGRFTRKGDPTKIGEATVVTNIADPEAERKLADLYAERADWDRIIKRLSEERIAEELRLPA